MKQLKEKKIGIFGLGISGISCFEFLKPSAKEIICWDDKDTNKLDKNFMIPLSEPNWYGLDIIIISPGVPKSHHIFALALKHNIPISSDIEIFLANNPKAKIIAITGTNGKSTTTALIHHIISNNNIEYHMGGNIGMPVLSLPQNKDGYILELSSFQLDLLGNISADISVLLNITPDHTDRYKTHEEYCQSKKSILSKKGINIIGVNSKDSCNIYENLKTEGKGELIPIGYQYEKTGVNCYANSIVDNFFDKKSYNIPCLNNLLGVCNQENIAATFAVCRSLGINGERIIKHLETFQGLKHRMQFIGTYKNISFYNDSKATNTYSATSALLSLNNIFWLAGGIFKEKDMHALEESIKNIKRAYLFGKSKSLFANYLEGKVEYRLHKTMHEAFEAAICDADSPELKDFALNIVLAPACASFDQFKDFEDRGDRFIKSCKNILIKN